MIFEPSVLATQWDTWVIRHGERHYLFYLGSTTREQPWDAIGLAVSADGVHFIDHGPVIRKADDAVWLGTGDTWRADGRFVMNFSEARGGRQEIFFAESDDLFHWDRLPGAASRLDPRWYADGSSFSAQRWDCICVPPQAPGAGWVGYLTAIAQDGPEGARGTAGMVCSTDGVKFEARPPVIEPGLWGDRIEVGGVAEVDGVFYMLISQMGVPLGGRWGSHRPGGVGGTYVLRSESREGPFERDPRQAGLLMSSRWNATYFARFYQCGAELLATHQAVPIDPRVTGPSPRPGTTTAPFKRVVVNDGLVQLGWWTGNEALKDRVTYPDLDVAGSMGCVEVSRHGESMTVDSPAGGLVPIVGNFDVDRGIVVETSMVLGPGHGRASRSAGLLIEHQRRRAGTAVLLTDEDTLVIGQYNGYGFRCDDEIVVRGLEGSERRWRVLLRGRFVEIYINDVFGQAFSLDDVASGGLQVISEGGAVSVGELRVWSMSLSA